MKQSAFTLIELLIVIVIIGLLATLMIPTMESASRMARQVQCVSNLGQIGSAFPVAQSMVSRQGEPMYPTVYEWPMVPQTAVGNGAIFLCPEDSTPVEEKDSDSRLEDYALFLREEAEGIYINFQLTDARPYRLVFDRGDYWEFWFEDGRLKDIDHGVDFVFHVSKSKPHVAVFQDVSHNTPRITALVFQKKVIPGWENLSVNAKGDDLVMGGSGVPCDYGLNSSVASRDSVAPDTIILLDYDTAIANRGEDMGETIEAAARHMGMSNVLYGDGSITSKGPIELDPLVNPDPWTAD